MYLMAGDNESFDEMRTDESSATRDKVFHMS
jgi:hypothetical protein